MGNLSTHSDDFDKDRWIDGGSIDDSGVIAHRLSCFIFYSHVLLLFSLCFVLLLFIVDYRLRRLSRVRLLTSPKASLSVALMHLDSVCLHTPSRAGTSILTLRE